MVKSFLVTTAIEETWPKNKSILFLGEWCKKFSRKEQWKKNDSEVLPYHWDNRAKLHADYLYLQDFYEKLLHELTDNLNQIHDTKYSVRYWRIVIGPWLGYFIQIVFERWSSTQDAIHSFKISGTNILDYDEDLFVPNDMKDFIQLIYREDWNHNIYANIITKYTNIPFTTLSNDQVFKSLHVVATPSLSGKVKEKFIALYNKIASFFTRDTDAFFLNTYLSRINEIKLYFSMNQIPKLRSEIPTIKASVDESKRKWKLFGEKNQTEFEECVRNLIPQHIPTLYLEGFANIIDQVTTSGWPSKPKVIFTSSSFSADDFFKVYAAEKTEQGVPLVIGQHGGGIGTHLFSFYEDHQLAICDSYLSWGWTEISKPKVKPIGQFKAKYPLGIHHSKKNGIMLVTLKLPIQSYHLFSSPIAGQWVDYFNDQCNFVDTLTGKIRDVLTVRLKSDDLGWEPGSRWKERFPDIKIDEGHFNINNLIKESRIYVSTYNATTFLESLTMNVPTVMFWNPNHWELRDSAIPFFDRLKDVGILHDTPESAAEHVNAIWDDVNYWWEGDILQESIKSFKKRYSHTPKGGIANEVSYALNDVIFNSKHI
jgi:putative transferase (TIGR04331 family)